MNDDALTQSYNYAIERLHGYGWYVDHHGGTGMHAQDVVAAVTAHESVLGTMHDNGDVDGLNAYDVTTDIEGAPWPPAPKSS